MQNNKDNNINNSNNENVTTAGTTGNTSSNGDADSTYTNSNKSKSWDTTNSVGIVKRQIVRLFDDGDMLKLQSGHTFGPVDVAYETYGKLNNARDNAILIIHALSGDSHVAGRYSEDDRKPGWWDSMVGPGKAIDTNRYFVICSNCLGGCMGTTGPSSIDPHTNKPYGLRFPIITISDMVDVQVRLVDYLGIEKLHAVVGGSMGGMQVLDWAVRYPERVLAVIPVATTARLSAQGLAFDAVGRNAILTDEHFQNGDYYNTDAYPAAGLAVARMIGHITYLSEEAMHAKFGRSLQNSQHYRYILEREFSVESYLDHQGSSFVDRFDANTYLYFTKAMDYFDPSLGCGTLVDAMRKARGRFLVISFDSDWLFPPRHSRDIVNALIAANKDVTYANIDCPYGHDSFLLEKDVQGRLLSTFLHRCYEMAHHKTAAANTTISETTNLTSITDKSPVICCPKYVDEAYDRKHEKFGIYAGDRLDHRCIAQLIRPGSRVLDLGCGDGRLLALLAQQKNICGLGVTLNKDDIIACIDRGVSVVQYDIGYCPEELSDKMYDYVVLSQSLQVIRRPARTLKALLRIGKQVILSFPNFAYWRARCQLMFKGCVPVCKSLPYKWFETPEQWGNYMSISDFEEFLYTELHARLIRKIAFSSSSGKQITFAANWRADEAIFVISDIDADSQLR